MNEARQQLFAQGSRTLEHVSPTQAALLQHIRRAAFQAGHVWSQCLIAHPEIPSPGDWGGRQMVMGGKSSGQTYQRLPCHAMN